MKDFEILAKVPIFSNLNQSALIRIRSKMQKRSYYIGNMILMEDEYGDTFFAITKGKVKVTRISLDGKEVIFAFFGEGEFFGEISLLDREPRSANVIALEDTDVLMLKREDFIKFLEEYPEIAMSLLSQMAKRIIKSDEQIESLSLKRADHRIGKVLLRLADDSGTMRKGIIQVNNVPFTKDIAKMAGTSRETASRVMKLLVEKELIQRENRKLLIMDYTQFRRVFN